MSVLVKNGCVSDLNGGCLSDVVIHWSYVFLSLLLLLLYLFILSLICVTLYIYIYIYFMYSFNLGGCTGLLSIGLFLV